MTEQKYFAARGLGPIVGPFDTLDGATAFTHEYEKIRYPRKEQSDRPIFPASGWYVSYGITPAQGFEDAREYLKFDIEREDDRRRLNAEAAEREERN